MKIIQAIASFQSLGTESIDQHMDVIFCPYNLFLDRDNRHTKLGHVTNPSTEFNISYMVFVLRYDT